MEWGIVGDVVFSCNDHLLQEPKTRKKFLASPKFFGDFSPKKGDLRTDFVSQFHHRRLVVNQMLLSNVDTREADKIARLRVHNNVETILNYDEDRHHVYWTTIYYRATLRDVWDTLAQFKYENCKISKMFPDFLEGLKYLKKHDIVHGNIHENNMAFEGKHWFIAELIQPHATKNRASTYFRISRNISEEPNYVNEKPPVCGDDLAQLVLLFISTHVGNNTMNTQSDDTIIALNNFLCTQSPADPQNPARQKLANFLTQTQDFENQDYEMIKEIFKTFPTRAASNAELIGAVAAFNVGRIHFRADHPFLSKDCSILKNVINDLQFRNPMHGDEVEFPCVGYDSRVAKRSSKQLVANWMEREDTDLKKQNWLRGSMANNNLWHVNVEKILNFLDIEMEFKKSKSVGASKTMMLTETQHFFFWTTVHYLETLHSVIALGRLMNCHPVEKIFPQLLKGLIFLKQHDIPHGSIHERNVAFDGENWIIIGLMRPQTRVECDRSEEEMRREHGNVSSDLKSRRLCILGGQSTCGDDLWQLILLFVIICNIHHPFMKTGHESKKRDVLQARVASGTCTEKFFKSNEGASLKQFLIQEKEFDDKDYATALRIFDKGVEGFN
jgi:hypothetical protein